MEVKIGIQNAVRELVLDSAQSSDEVAELVATAYANGDGLLTLTDDKGRRVLVPINKLAYVEIAPGVERRVGFSA